MLKIGFISYLNAYPYYYPFEQKKSTYPTDWQFIVERPGVLNSLVRQGKIDLSLVSFMEYAINPHLYRIVKGIGLSSKGYVDSVKLLSKVPMSELAGCEIQVTSASATSVAVMQIILNEKGVKNYSCKTYDVDQGIPNCTAALTIGDEALLADTHAYPYSYDLGELWNELFHCCIIFAVCVIRHEVVDSKLPEVASFVQELLTAPDYCLRHHQNFEKSCHQRYPTIKNPLVYLDRLRFQMESQNDLEFFLNKATEHGLISGKVKPQYFLAPLELAGN